MPPQGPIGSPRQCAVGPEQPHGSGKNATKRENPAHSTLAKSPIQLTADSPTGNLSSGFLSDVRLSRQAGRRRLLANGEPVVRWTYYSSVLPDGWRSGVQRVGGI